MRRLNFHKGHGTANDFVIFVDEHGVQELTPQFIAAVCDRRTGVGADGLIRAVRAGRIHEWDGEAGLWFMDYYNADGSVAEMCGNGLRVFGRLLLNLQLVDELAFDVATRAGVKRVELEGHGLISVDVGDATVLGDAVTVSLGQTTRPATKVDVGNPHAVAFVPVDELAGLDLTKAPRWSPPEAYPQGVNVEFVAVTGPGRLAMRVYERGSGETMSCGTGVVASAAAYRAQTGFEGQVEVRVPGGDLTVSFDGDRARLTGPAVMVGRGEFWYHDA